MGAIANRFDAHPSRWILATGDVSTIHTLMRRFGVVTQTGADGVSDMHTTFVYILDANGKLKHMLLASPDLASGIYGAIKE